jgi:methylmalonyl-CoA mutase C-terminal domain/subunit
MTAGSGEGRRLRVLLAKPGLDGHDTGVKVVAQALRDAGIEVIYTGLRKTPAEIAKAAVEEGVDAVGLSILSGAHLEHCRAVKDALDGAGARDLFLLVGGVIPDADRPALERLGWKGIFPFGSRLGEIVSFLSEVGERVPR